MALTATDCHSSPWRCPWLASISMSISWAPLQTDKLSIKAWTKNENSTHLPLDLASMRTWSTETVRKDHDIICKYPQTKIRTQLSSSTLNVKPRALSSVIEHQGAMCLLTTCLDGQVQADHCSNGPLPRPRAPPLLQIGGRDAIKQDKVLHVSMISTFDDLPLYCILCP